MPVCWPLSETGCEPMLPGLQQPATKSAEAKLMPARSCRMRPPMPDVRVDGPGDRPLDHEKSTRIVRLAVEDHKCLGERACKGGGVAPSATMRPRAASW